MDNPCHCAQCGAALSVYALEGVCGNCLLGPGLKPMPELLAQPDGAKRSSDTKEVDRFGDYELLEEIARGGMGVVYRARQPSLERIVALKMILAGQFASEQIIKRFRGEVTAAALLQHPNIVAIHDVGIHNGQHYFSMDYVEGQNLSQLVGNRPLPPTKAARYVKLIAEAIHYAHGQGILHRDLKPSNVLIDSVTDQPRITDFGLAKRLDGESSLTVTGQVLGSPNFMPPEQAGGGHGKVGRHSDVYGLGAILYYLLTARAPFQADSLEGIVTQVLQSEPIPPRALNPSVPRDLETICLKCLTKEPHQRYATSGELAEELGRFLKDEPIMARPIGPTARLWRWCRRNPVVASLGIALVLAITIGFAVVTWRLREEHRTALSARQDLYTADMNRVYQAWSEGSLQRAENLLRAHIPKAHEEDLRGFEWRLLSQLCRDESLFTFTNINFAGEHHGLTLAADGQTAIAASGDSLKWLDGQQQREVRTEIVATNAITALSLATDQPGLVAYRSDRIHALAPNGEALLGAGLDRGWGGGPILWSDGAFALSPDGSLLAASGTNKATTVRIFDGRTGQPVGPELDLGEKENILSLAFSPDSKRLACGTLGTKIHILQVPTLKSMNVITGYTSGFNRLIFNRAGTKLVAASGDSHIRIWNFPACDSPIDLVGYQGGVNDFAISPDGLQLVSGGQDHTIRVWDLANLSTRTFLHGHRGSVTSLIFSSDGSQLYSGSDDKTVKVWDMTSQESTNTLHHPDWTDEVSFSPDGTLLAVSDFNAHAAALWRLSTRSQIMTVANTRGHAAE